MAIMRKRRMQYSQDLNFPVKFSIFARRTFSAYYKVSEAYNFIRMPKKAFKRGEFEKMTEKRISVIGGDMRQAALTRELASRGFDVRFYGIDIYKVDFGDAKKCASAEEALTGADIVILPLPADAGGIYINAPFTNEEITIDEIAEGMPRGALLLGGKISPEFLLRIEERGIRCIDYYEREELTVMNAIPTAEGAIAIAMEELPITLHNMKAAVLGFGRVANILAHKAAALGVDVTVFARKSHARAWARAYGYEAMDFDALAEQVAGYDCIFNTVPKMVIDRGVLDGMRRDTLIIDLASKPGGVDYGYANTLGIKAILALSLPGRVAPDTAGGYIADTVINIIYENQNEMKYGGKT